MNTDLKRLWIAQTISKFGSWVGGGALGLTAILVLDATPVQMGLLAAAASLPVLLFGLLAGAMVDRLRRRPILLAADIGRGLLLASIPVAWLLGVLRFEHLLGVAGLVALLTIFFDVASQAYLPALARRENLVEANSRFGASEAAAEVAGPPLGGLLVQLIGAPLTILADALSFLVSALWIGRIRAPELRPSGLHHEAGEGRQALSSVTADIREGLRATVAHPVLRALLGVTVIFGLAGGVIGSLYTLYAIRELGLSPALIGIVTAVGGAGSLLGALLAERLARRLGVGGAIVAALGVVGMTQLLLPLAHGPWALAVLMLAQVGDFAWTVYLVNELSLRQAVTPDRLLGRVNASVQFVAAAAAPLGALIGGTAGQVFGLRPAVALGSVILLLAWVWALRSPLRSLRALPEDGEVAVAIG